MFEILKKLFYGDMGCIAKTIIADTQDTDSWTIKSRSYNTYYTYRKGERTYNISINDDCEVILMEANYTTFDGWEQDSIANAIGKMVKVIEKIETTRKYEADVRTLKIIFPNCFRQ